MRIGIDGRLVTHRRGIGNLVFHLLHALSKIAGDYSLVIYVADAAARRVVPDDPRFSVRVLIPRLYPLWEQFSLPVAAAQDRLDVLHCPANTAPVFLNRTLPLILSVMDVMYLLPHEVLPKSSSWYQRVGRRYLRHVVPLVARRASAIVTISEHSKLDIVKYLGVHEDRITVTPLAAHPAYFSVPDKTLVQRALSKYGLVRPYVLALGAIDPRKNTERIVRAFAAFQKKGSTNHQLALAGLSGPMANAYVRLAKSLGIAECLKTLEFVSDAELIALYSAAEMFVYPSLYEGFGLPIIEAMACGTPVITSERGSILEVAGGAAMMVNPLDVEEIASAMYRLAWDVNLREALIEKGRARAAMYSWQKTAERTFQVYERVVGDRMKVYE